MNTRNTGVEGKQSRVIQARLHPSDDYERDALLAYDTWLSMGYSPREIITDCILARADRTPEMYRREGRINGVVHELENGLSELRDIKGVIASIPDLITSALDQRIGDILLEIKRADPGRLREFANHDDTNGEVELSNEFIENARKAARKSFKQRQNEG